LRVISLKEIWSKGEISEEKKGMTQALPFKTRTLPTTISENPPQSHNTEGPRKPMTEKLEIGGTEPLPPCSPKRTEMTLQINKGPESMRPTSNLFKGGFGAHWGEEE